MAKMRSHYISRKELTILRNFRFHYMYEGNNGCACLGTGKNSSYCVDINKYKNTVEQCGVCQASDNCTDSSATCSAEVSGDLLCSTCVDRAVRKALESCKADCVETEWLHENGLEQGILWDSGVARTLCIPGLPCGTEGHLLRKCDKNGSCMLLSYKEMCEERTDCYSKYAKVSRLSAKFDWSSVQLENCSKDKNSITLTSLSIDTEGKDMGVSILVAFIGDKMISYGFGSVVDALSTTWDQLKNTNVSLFNFMLLAATK